MIVAALFLCASSSCLSPACAQDELPLLEDMDWPSVETLLKADPFDWIVLKDQTVIVCQPLYPHPDTLQKMADELVELEQAQGQQRGRTSRHRRTKEATEAAGSQSAG